jgi:cytochrome c-type biogenesis protein CcmH
MFWLATLTMILLALFMLFYRARVRVIEIADNKEEIVATYKHQFDDVETDANNGTINAEQAEIVKRELEYALLKEVEGKTGSESESESQTPLGGASLSDWTLNTLVIVLLPILAFALYYRIGQPQLASSDGAMLIKEQSPSDEKPMPTIEELVLGLEDRLKQTPEDETAWWMLTRSYMALGRFDDALQSVERLNEISGDTAPVMLLKANVMMLVKGDSFVGEPEGLIQRSLELEPESVSGLWMAGLAARERGDEESAITYWQRLLLLVEADEAASEEILALLAEVLGADATGAVLAKNKNETANKKVQASNSVTVNVTLAPEFKEEYGPDDILFVFARADDGMPMPVAASRLRVADLPASLILNDEQAMMPSRLISSFKEVEVLARISKSGQAIAQSGDLSSAVVLSRVGAAETVELLINQRVP